MKFFMLIQKKIIDFLGAVFAGAMIAIGTIIYLSCMNTMVGAIFFSIGLIMIFEYGFNLYTGQVGSARTPQDVMRLAVIFAGNFVGCFVAAIAPQSKANIIWATKLTIDPCLAAVRSFD